MAEEILLELWKQIEPTVVLELKPGEKKQVGKLIVEKTEEGDIVIYELSDGDEED